MAKQLTKTLNLEVVAGKAQPAPPLGPMLWSNGVNIGQFITEFNSKTAEHMKQFAPADVKMRVKLDLYSDRTFDMYIIGPVTSNLILWKIGQKLWSGEPNKKKLWQLTRKDLEEIAELKRGDMNSDNMESMVKSIAGTARNMGVEVKMAA